jgi:hypothetical protein
MERKHVISSKKDGVIREAESARRTRHEIFKNFSTAIVLPQKGQKAQKYRPLPD